MTDRTRFVLGAFIALAGILLLWLLATARNAGGDSAVSGGAEKRRLDLLTETADAGAAEPPTAQLSGKVLDPQGQPAEGALVWASDATGRLRQARTGPLGAFTLAKLPAGEYRVAAQRGAETTQPLGPLPLGAGDDLRDLVLALVPGARIAGGVFDLRSRAPLPGAVIAVVATPHSAIADDRGRFSLPPLPPGGHQLSVQAEGHLTRLIPLQARPADDTRALEIYLTAAAHLSGRVLAKDGTGVPQAQLLSSRYQPAGAGPALAPLGATTDDAGHFALDLPPGLCRLVARSPGFGEAQSEMLELVEGKALEVTLTLAPGGHLSGTVLSADGQPVSGGQIGVFRGGGGWKVGEGGIGAGGRFDVSGLPPGHFLVSADALQARATAEFDLEEGGEAQVQLRLGDHSLEGMVVGSGDRPVAGALVVARPVGPGEAGERSALSGTDGRFKIAGLSGDKFDLAATKDEGSAEQRGVAAGAHDVRLSLGAGGVRGTVLGPGGTAVSDFYVAAEPELPGKGRPRATAAVDGRGEFHLALAPGRYRLRATAPGFAEGAVEGIEVLNSAETGGVRIELRPAGTISGTVVDEKGAPVPGIHVATDRGHAWGVGRDSPLGGSGALSGPDGRFALRDVPPGNWPIFASGSGWDQAGWQMVTVAGGQNPAPIEVKLRKADGPGDQLYAGIGMSLFPQADRKFAGEVFAGGPAQEAGIRSGDEILAVDGLPAAGHGIGELVSHIRGPQGSEVTLEMRRGESAQYSVVVPRAEIRF